MVLPRVILSIYDDAVDDEPVDETDCELDGRLLLGGLEEFVCELRLLDDVRPDDPKTAADVLRVGINSAARAYLLLELVVAPAFGLPPLDDDVGDCFIFIIIFVGEPLDRTGATSNASPSNKSATRSASAAAARDAITCSRSIRR